MIVGQIRTNNIQPELASVNTKKSSLVWKMRRVANATMPFLLSVCALVLGLSSQVAQASPTASLVDTKTITVQAVMPQAAMASSSKTSSNALLQAVGGIIVMCTMQIQFPHNSGHNPGMVNVVGTAACTVPMSNIWLDAELYYNGVDYAYGYSYSNVGRTSAQVNAATPCQNGSYYALMHWYVQWPPNVTPITPTTSGTLISSTVPIAC